ncbi:MAG: hypothetical protein GX576_05370 [Thauera phenolivorans]|uniref:Uncharacterized protein n=1 Tax=Thauera phenolivorans TaxID=1792543 RepID=A0A7X7R7R9_9RHOO|nr:hypothetical protein [Thauera phenolivorans]NLF53819.1 hypothetical protein [Thauera phenolivorans]
MLSIRDCLDYCGISDDEVALIAEHASISGTAAAQLACALVQTEDGVLLLTECMREMGEHAHRNGDTEKAERAHRIRMRFLTDYPSQQN